MDSVKIEQCRWTSGEARNRNSGDLRDAQLVLAFASTEICETAVIWEGCSERESIVAVGLYVSALRVGYASLVER